MKEFIFENCYKWISFTENDDPIKVKPYHELFLKEKLKKLQASETVRNLSNNDIKFVLKTIKQLNIITQKLEMIEKSNIFDIESFIKEHPETWDQIIKAKTYYSKNKKKCKFIKNQKSSSVHYN